MNQQKQSMINESVDYFFGNWQFDESPVSILSLLLADYLADPLDDFTKENQLVSEQITSMTLSVGALMGLLNDLKNNLHLKEYVPELVNQYFCRPSNNAESYSSCKNNMCCLLVHYLNHNKDFEIALTVPGIAHVMELLINLHGIVKEKVLIPAELN